MKFCENEIVYTAGEGSLVRAVCDKPATIKHDGKWYCEWCFDHLKDSRKLLDFYYEGEAE